MLDFVLTFSLPARPRLPHTLEHWPKELYLTDPVIDRTNRENWQDDGSVELYERACAEVDKRLTNYQPFETDSAIDAELRRLVIDGLNQQTELPKLPPATEPPAKVNRLNVANKVQRLPASTRYQDPGCWILS